MYYSNYKTSPVIVFSAFYVCIWWHSSNQIILHLVSAVCAYECNIITQWVCLTRNTCRGLYKLSIEVRNDCVTFFSWLHPEVRKDTLSISLSAVTAVRRVVTGTFQDLLPFRVGGWRYKLTSPMCLYVHTEALLFYQTELYAHTCTRKYSSAASS